MTTPRTLARPTVLMLVLGATSVAAQPQPGTGVFDKVQIRSVAADALAIFGGVTVAGNAVVTGTVTVSGNGSTFATNQAGLVRYLFQNTNGGTTSATIIDIGNNAAGTAGEIIHTSSTFPPSGSLLTDSLVVSATRAGGLSLAASHASGEVRLYSGGVGTPRVTIQAGGNMLTGLIIPTADASASGLIINGRVSDNASQIVMGSNNGATPYVHLIAASTPSLSLATGGVIRATLSNTSLALVNALSVGGTLAVTGATTLSSTLGVTGTSSMSGSLTMADAAPILADTGTNGGYMFSGDADTGVRQDGAQRLQLLVDNTPMLTLTTSPSTNLFVSGDLLPDGAGSSLGASGTPWNEVWVDPTTTAAAANAVISAGNQLLESTSTRRAKTDIRPLSMNEARRLLRVDAVTYRGRNPGDGTRRWAGFIAEDVAAVDPTLVTFDADGHPKYVTYDRVPAYLLPLVQDLYRRVESLERHRGAR